VLPSTVNVRSTNGDRRVRVEELGATDVPAHSGGSFAWELQQAGDWDGHRRDDVQPFLCKWTFPEKVQEIKDRVETVLEEGIPDQRRTMLRNQDSGMFDDRWITDVALGEEVEDPFCRWSKAATGEVRVAVCLDATAPWYTRKETLEARMCVAAGLASALEMLDYEVSVIGACLYESEHTGRPARRAPKHARGTVCLATVMKGEDEPLVDSGFAHFADTGLRRLVCCWVTKANNFATHLSDSEWRELTDADLFVYLGPARGDSNVVNESGIPSGEGIGPVGDDVLNLKVNGYSDVDRALGTLETFFQNMQGE